LKGRERERERERGGGEGVINSSCMALSCREKRKERMRKK